MVECLHTATMIYRSAGQPIDPEVELHTLSRRLASRPGSPGHDTVVDLFVETAELDAAMADHIFPHEDGRSALCDR